MSEWRHGRLGELASGVRGVSYSPEHLKEFKTPNTVALLRANNIQDGQLFFDEIQIVPRSIVADKQILGDGDIAVCMSNGSKMLVGKAAQMRNTTGREPFTVGAFCSVFRPTVDSDKGFVSFVFQSSLYRKYLDLALAGSAINNLRNGDLENFSVPIPPVTEQCRIAEILDTVDETIRKTEQLIAKLQLAKQGLLHDLLTRGIDDNGELRDPDRHPEQFKESALGRIPRDWEVGGIEQYLTHDGLRPGPFGSSITKDMYLKAGYRVYGQEQVIGGTLAIGDYYVSASKYAELSAFAVEEWDILISLVGTVGRALVVRAPFELGVINPRLMRLRPSRQTTDVEFLKHLLVSWIVKRQLERRATGGTMTVLNSSVMRSVRVPIVPMDEQRAIGCRLDALDSRVDKEIAMLAKLKLVKQGLMDDLLTGRVRVPLDMETTT